MTVNRLGGVTVEEYRTPQRSAPEGESGASRKRGFSKMGDFKKYLMTGLVILIVISVYNSFVKTYLPTGIRSIVGLG